MTNWPTTSLDKLFLAINAYVVGLTLVFEVMAVLSRGKDRTTTNPWLMVSIGLLAYVSLAIVRKLEYNQCYERQSQRYRLIKSSIPTGSCEKIMSWTENACNPERITCPICLIDVEKQDMIGQCETCRQSFHKDCIFSWLTRSDSCPCCRRQLLPASTSLAKGSDALSEFSAFLGYYPSSYSA